MELLMILLPGVLGGGLILAVLIARFGSRVNAAPDARLEPPSPHLINMAHIRVAGVGGLGLVAMAIVVAIFVPLIRVTMTIALLLGVALAAALIAFRRRQGPFSPRRGTVGTA
jgi:hypothetical protein